MRQNRQLLSAVMKSLFAENSICCAEEGSRQLIQSDQKYRAFRSRGFGNQLPGALTIILEHAHPHPPIARWAREFQHLRRAIAAFKMFGKLLRRFFVRESADLHSPLSSAAQRRGSFHNFHSDFRNSCMVNAE